MFPKPYTPTPWLPTHILEAKWPWTWPPIGDEMNNNFSFSLFMVGVWKQLITGAYCWYLVLYTTMRGRKQRRSETLRWIVFYPLTCWIICKIVTSFSGLRLISIINLSLNKSPFLITHYVVIKHSAQSFRRAVNVLIHWVTSQPYISVHLNF